MTEPRTRWVVLSDHRRRPSPYFAQLERYAQGSTLELEFASGLSDLAGPPGVVNLHRLKRLYRDPRGTPTVAAVRSLLHQLRRLRAEGWRVVWTLHNLYPIDTRRRRLPDLLASYGVGWYADAVLCHTRSDATWLRGRPGVRGLVDVAGWGGLPSRAETPVPEPVRELARRMAADPAPYLLFGNVSRYKGVRPVVEAFLAADLPDATLYVVGSCRDEAAANWLAGLPATRVRRHLERVSPDHAHLLYAAAYAAVCPYQATGAQRFFRHAIFPSSVGTAVAFGVPVVAPDLPAIREMLRSHPHALYPADAELTGALRAVSALPDDRTGRVPEDDAERWSRIVECYERTARRVTCGTASTR